MITFVTLSRPCLFSKTPHPVLNGQYQVGYQENQEKLNEKYMSALHCVLSFEGTWTCS